MAVAILILAVEEVIGRGGPHIDHPLPKTYVVAMVPAFIVTQDFSGIGQFPSLETREQREVAVTADADNLLGIAVEDTYGIVGIPLCVGSLDGVAAVVHQLPIDGFHVAGSEVTMAIGKVAAIAGSLQVAYAWVGGKEEVGLAHLVVVLENVPRVRHTWAGMILDVISDAVEIFLAMQTPWVIEPAGTG